MRRLYERDGRPDQDEERDDLLASLIDALLSQATHHENATRAYATLLERFDADFERIAEADVEQIAEAIRIGGLSKQKAPRLQAMLRQAHERFGAYTLEPLHEMPPEEAYKELIAMRGIGPKSATFVLMRAARMPFFSMSQRILRVSKRLGWVSDSMSSKACHDRLLPHIPQGEHDALHVALIEHGKARCTPRAPQCSNCPLLDLCPHGQTQRLEAEKL